MDIIGREVKSKATGAIGHITGISGNKLDVTFEGGLSVTVPMDVLIVDDDIKKEVEENWSKYVPVKKERKGYSSSKRISPLILQTPNILYCNIAYMKYYKGINKDDIPYNGGRYIGETGNAGEKYNFCPFDDKYVYGFFEPGFTKGGYENGRQKELHIENIDPSCIDSDHLDNVIIIMCARAPYFDKTVMVGWYDNATVYRKVTTFGEGDSKKWMNCKCKIEDAHLIPESNRIFSIPRASVDGQGMGQSNYWYANNDEDYDFRIETLEYIKSIR